MKNTVLIRQALCGLLGFYSLGCGVKGPPVPYVSIEGGSEASVKIAPNQITNNSSDQRVNMTKPILVPEITEKKRSGTR